MNEKNFEYLRDQVKFSGFGEALANDLREKMQKQVPEFQLAYQTKFGNDTAVTALHFKKSNQSEMYFFNRYHLTLKPDHSPDKQEQTFYLNKGNNITLKEAYNLMSGRAVNKDLTTKEGHIYNAWVQLNFKQTDPNGNHKIKQFHQNYGFDLEQVLAKHLIKELANEPDKSPLMESLQKGNRQAVTFLQNGHEQKYFVEANPQFKTLTIHDNNMQRLGNRQAKEEKPVLNESTTVKLATKKESQTQADDDPDMPKTANQRRKKPNQSLS